MLVYQLRISLLVILSTLIGRRSFMSPQHRRTFISTICFTYHDSVIDQCLLDVFLFSTFEKKKVHKCIGHDMSGAEYGGLLLDGMLTHWEPG